MEIISANANNTPPVEALVEQSRRLLLGSFVGFFFPHKDLPDAPAGRSWKLDAEQQRSWLFE